MVYKQYSNHLLWKSTTVVRSWAAEASWASNQQIYQKLVQQKITIKSIVVMSSSSLSLPAGPIATAWLREENDDDFIGLPSVDKQTSRICNEHCSTKILKESRIVTLKYLIYYKISVHNNKCLQQILVPHLILYLPNNREEVKRWSDHFPSRFIVTLPAISTIISCHPSRGIPCISTAVKNHARTPLLDFEGFQLFVEKRRQKHVLFSVALAEYPQRCQIEMNQ